MTSVRFRNFWPSFDEEENIFLKTLSESFGSVSVSKSKTLYVDVEFWSVFRSRREQSIARIKQLINQSITTDPALATTNLNTQIRANSGAGRRIWYTGENIRPPLMSKFDAYLSFDQDTYDGRNAYLPLWWLRLNWFEKSKYSSQVGLPIDMDQLQMKRELESTKTKFACAFVGNPHPIRMHFIEKLGKLGQVDVFGRAVGRPISNKYEVAREYKYAVCFENDNYPGYVTEKLIDAYVTQTVPIYWGNLGIDDTVNEASFLNLTNYSSISELIEKIHNLDYEEIYRMNFLKKKPSLNHVKELILGSMVDD